MFKKIALLTTTFLFVLSGIIATAVTSANVPVQEQYVLVTPTPKGTPIDPKITPTPVDPSDPTPSPLPTATPTNPSDPKPSPTVGPGSTPTPTGDYPTIPAKPVPTPTT